MGRQHTATRAANIATAGTLLRFEQLLVFTLCYGSFTCASFADDFLYGKFVPRVISLWCVSTASLLQIRHSGVNALY